MPATGGNFAFEFPPTDVLIEYTRIDGAKDSAHVNVIAVVSYIVMKIAALGRGKPKEAYDIYYATNSYPGGVRKIAEDFMPYVEAKLVQSMCQKLSEKFASTQHAGPVDVAAFLGVTDKDEKERVKQDVYQKVRYLVERLTK